MAILLLWQGRQLQSPPSAPPLQLWTKTSLNKIILRRCRISIQIKISRWSLKIWAQLIIVLLRNLSKIHVLHNNRILKISAESHFSSRGSRRNSSNSRSEWKSWKKNWVKRMSCLLNSFRNSMNCDNIQKIPGWMLRITHTQIVKKEIEQWNTGKTKCHYQ